MTEKSSAWFAWDKMYPHPLNWKGWLSVVVFVLIVVLNAFILKFEHGVMADGADFLWGFIFVVVIFIILAKIKS